MFVKWLQKELDTRDWNQTKLAKKAGILPASLSRIMNDSRNPGPDVCKALAKALSIPQETVFRAAGLLDPTPEADPLSEEWDHIFGQATTEEERQRLLAIARFELKRILEDNK